MERPLCKLCQHRHYPSEPHIWKAEPAGPPKGHGRSGSTVSVPSAPTVMLSSLTFSGTQVATGSSAANVKSERFDRAAYQKEYMREYMRKRRLREGK